jgi:hypothetical protein
MAFLLILFTVWALLAAKQIQEQQMMIRQLLAERQAQNDPAIYVQQGIGLYRVKIVANQIWCERRNGQNIHVKDVNDYALPITTDRYWNIDALHYVIFDYKALEEGDQ